VHVPEVPVGLPSALLERRPDIRQAEQLLIAANADIGVAKAAYFPQIALTAGGGVQSTALSALFTTPAGLWAVGAGLTQPIFNAGRTRSRVALSKAQQDEAVLAISRRSSSRCVRCRTHSSAIARARLSRATVAEPRRDYARRLADIHTGAAQRATWRRQRHTDVLSGLGSPSELSELRLWAGLSSARRLAAISRYPP
jgi:multidrug efflux system outer membrane protein